LKTQVVHRDERTTPGCGLEGEAGATRFQATGRLQPGVRCSSGGREEVGSRAWQCRGARECRSQREQGEEMLFHGEDDNCVTMTHSGLGSERYSRHAGKWMEGREESLGDSTLSEIREEAIRFQLPIPKISPPVLSGQRVIPNDDRQRLFRPPRHREKNSVNSFHDESRQSPSTPFLRNALENSGGGCRFFSL